MITDHISQKSNLSLLGDTKLKSQISREHIVAAVTCLALSILNKFCLYEKLPMSLSQWSLFFNNRTVATILPDDNSFGYITIAVIIPALSWFCMYKIISMTILKSIGVPKKRNHELLTNQAKICPNQSTSADVTIYNSNPLVRRLESALAHKESIQSLSTEDSITAFKEIMKLLAETQESHNYGKYLREAEELLLKTEEECPSNFKNDITQMRDQYHVAFQNMPCGPSLLTQLDIDYLKRSALVPNGVICQNSWREKFSKPSISVNQLVSHFFSLGYSKVMHSREVADFEGMKEICDIILLGIKKNFSFFPTFFSSENDEKSTFFVEIEKLRDHFLIDKKATELGYQNAEIKLIAELKDQESANQFIHQGFQICVILVYPKVQSF